MIPAQNSQQDQTEKTIVIVRIVDTLFNIFKVEVYIFYKETIENGELEYERSS